MASDILHSLHTLVPIFMLVIFTRLIVRSSAAIPNEPTSTCYNPASTNRSKIQAVFVFGDSTVDSGNNNFLLTDFRSNFPPYGHDFVGSQPTGRFTNGRLVTDFIASYAGIKEYIPPYLDQTLDHEELKTGVCFASAASGFDPLTAKLSNVLSIPTQLEYFREYRTKLEKAIGKQEMDHIIENSGVIISAGTNDLAVNYFLLPVRRKTYTVLEYQQYLLGQLKQLIQELMNEGVKTFGVVGLPPIGCIPFVITLYAKDKSGGRGCVESLSSVARSYNEMVKKELSSTLYQSNGVKVVYADIYTSLDLIVQNPRKFGFEEVLEGCCGTGVLETSYLCNPISPLCSDVSKYVFFDAVHPTEKTYNILFEYVKPILDKVLSEV